MVAPPAAQMHKQRLQMTKKPVIESSLFFDGLQQRVLEMLKTASCRTENTFLFISNTCLLNKNIVFLRIMFALPTFILASA
jgi:hypothetical protein